MQQTLPPYSQQYDKIIEAYFRNEIEPYGQEFCFCGTIGAIKYENGRIEWRSDYYSDGEYRKMEYELLSIIRDETIVHVKQDIYIPDEKLRDKVRNHPNYENAIFNGMCAALEVLKQIHIERGEVIEEPKTPFTKRQLQAL